MLAGQMQRAVTPLEIAYKSRPLAEQPRALVLNHALLDVALKQNAMRAVKDLREYLGAQDASADEQAVNLLGAALEVAGHDERMRETELYMNAEQQLEKSIKLLERGRPGERKWGTPWKPDKEFADLQAKRQASQQALRAANQELRKRLKDAEQAAAKVDRLEDKGSAGKKKVVQKRSAQLDAARHESTEAEQRYAQQKPVVAEARKNLFEPTWSTELAPIDPATPNARRAPAPSTQPK